MSLNCSEIDLILSELKLENSFIQKIWQTDYQNLFFQIYSPGKGYNLHICVAPGETRICRTARRGGKMKKPPRFTEFLRSRLRGARIKRAGQVNGDRIIRFDISKGDVNTILWVRLWGNAANVIVTNDKGAILEAQYRRPKKDEQKGGSYYIDEQENAACDSQKYPIREWEGASFNGFIDDHYAAYDHEKDLAGLRRQALSEVERKQNYYELLYHKLLKRQDEFENSEELKVQGDLIMANMSIIEKGAPSVTLLNFYDDDNEITIKLDPKKNPYENAQALYNRHKKNQRGLALQTDEIENAARQKEYWDDKRLRIEDTDDTDELRDLLPDKEVRVKTEAALPGLQYMSDGFLILVGRTAKENDALLRRHVRGNDYWLHTRDYPGGYVFVKCKKGKSLPLETLLDAGNLALHYSKAKNNGEADLYYTQVKYLRRAKNGPLGLVLPTHEKNIHIKRDEGRMNKMMKGASS